MEMRARRVENLERKCGRRSLEDGAEDGDAVIEEAASDRPLGNEFGGDGGGIVDVGLLAFADLAGEGRIVDEKVIFVVEVETPPIQISRAHEGEIAVDGEGFGVE